MPKKQVARYPTLRRALRRVIAAFSRAIFLTKCQSSIEPKPIRAVPTSSWRLETTLIIFAKRAGMSTAAGSHRLRPPPTPLSTRTASTMKVCRSVCQFSDRCRAECRLALTILPWRSATHHQLARCRRRAHAWRNASGEEEKKKERRKIPIFCLAAILANAGVFVVEIWVNGWQLQPFSCPSTCSNGMPCYEDGFTECEPNPMLGPRIAVLQRLGAKDDLAIFERGEWWRIAACNWLHAGVIHCLLNMGAIWAIGGDLERVFGFCRVAVLYMLSGLFGTVVSIVFLPGTLSVGASASVFGLVGANWADIIVNFCARCTLKGSGVVCLTIATILNVAIGFTPFVDNFMHMGGMVAGLVIGLASFAQKAHRDPATGRRVHTCLQEAVVLVAVALLLLLGGGAVVAVLSSELQALLRSLPWARHVNCISTPWWSCCVMASGKGHLPQPPAAAKRVEPNLRDLQYDGERRAV